LLEICGLVPRESVLDPDAQQCLLSSSDLDLGETIKRISGSIERRRAKRVDRSSVRDPMLAQARCG